MCARAGQSQREYSEQLAIADKGPIIAIADFGPFPLIVPAPIAIADFGPNFAIADFGLNSAECPSEASQRMQINKAHYCQKGGAVKIRITVSPNPPRWLDNMVEAHPASSEPMTQ